MRHARRAFNIPESELSYLEMRDSFQVSKVFFCEVSYWSAHVTLLWVDDVVCGVVDDVVDDVGQGGEWVVDDVVDDSVNVILVQTCR
jgi:hypothetical protein